MCGLWNIHGLDVGVDRITVFGVKCIGQLMGEVVLEIMNVGVYESETRFFKIQGGVEIGN